jgi:hypothetical protein
VHATPAAVQPGYIMMGENPRTALALDNGSNTSYIISILITIVATDAIIHHTIYKYINATIYK